MITATKRLNCWLRCTKNLKARASVGGNKAQVGLKGKAGVQPALPTFYHSKNMKTNLIIPTVFLVVFVLNVLFGSGVDSWWSFLIGVIFALAAQDVGKELMRRVARR